MRHGKSMMLPVYEALVSLSSFLSSKPSALRPLWVSWDVEVGIEPEPGYGGRGTAGAGA